jgi:hypothetical protein
MESIAYLKGKLRPMEKALQYLYSFIVNSSVPENLFAHIAYGIKNTTTSPYLLERFEKDKIS